MRNLAPWILVALALVGLWLGVDLTDAHYVVKYQPEASMDQWCDVSGTFNCSEVARSKYSAIPIGDGPAMPVSVPAVGFFAALGLLALLAGLAGDEERRRKGLAVIALALVPALGFSFYLLAVQVFALGTYCIKCLLLDGTVLASLIVAIVGHGGGLGGLKDDLTPPSTRDLATAVVVGLLVLVPYCNGYQSKAEVAIAKNAALAAKSSPKSADDHAGHAHAAGEHPDESQSLEDLSPEQQEEVRKQLQKILEEARAAISKFYDEYDSFPKKELDTNAFDAKKGATNAPVQVIEFADVECPHCQMAAPQIKDLIARYGDTVELVFKNYPLGKKCNPELSRDMHPDACDAAVAIQCAGRQGDAFGMHDAVFATAASGESIKTKALKRIAGELDLDTNQFAACLTSDDAWEEVRLQVGDGRKAGITGTPSFFVNGVQMPSPHPAFVEAAVRRELLNAGITDLPADQDGVFGN